MILTLQDKNGTLVIDFDVKWSHYEERYIPYNITESGKYTDLTLTDKQYDKVLDYLDNYEPEELHDPDHLIKWLNK